MPTFNNGESGASVREKINEAINKVESIQASLVNINAKLDVLLSANILDLFANGEQGAWYDPSDLTTLYQDAAGNTPVTADGDPVGLMLDKSQGLKLGPELVGFSGSYELLSDYVASLGGTYPAGTQFLCEVQYTYSGDNALKASLGPLDTSNGTFSFTGGGTVTFYLQSGVDVDEFVIQDIGSGAGTFITSVSVRELPGNHATQSTAAARPVYRTDGTLHWLEFDGVDDRLQNDSVDFGTDTALVFIAALNNNVPDSEFYAHHAFKHSKGTIQLYTRTAVADNIAFQADLNTRVTASASGPAYAPPNLAVMRGVLDLAAPLLSLHQNGELVDQSTTSTGASTIGIGPLTVGARDSGANSRQDFYGCIWRGSLLTESEIASTEAYLASKSGVTL